MNDKDAREIVANGPQVKLVNETLDVDQIVKRCVLAAGLYGEAKGYLSALEGEEVKALVEALESCRAEGALPSFTDDKAEEALAAFRKAVCK